MADDDIYGNQAKYERYKKNYKDLLIPAEERKSSKNRYRAKYYCKNPDNIKYFPKLFTKLDSKDKAYVSRIWVCEKLKIWVHYSILDLNKITSQDETDEILAQALGNGIKNRADLVKGIKQVWKLLFPKNLHVVEHLKKNVHKSKEKRRDILTWQEYEQVLGFFVGEPCMQFYVSLATESLARPQEMLYLRRKNVEVLDNYARIELSEHTKTGIGIVQCIDSYPYLLRWLKVHPLSNEDAFLFLNKYAGQLTPYVVNKRLHRATKKLGIKKTITPYS